MKDMSTSTALEPGPVLWSDKPIRHMLRGHDLWNISLKFVCEG